MTYLLLTITSWDEPPRARHQIARALAEHERVIFVARNETGSPGLTEREVEPGIKIMTPSWPLDYRLRYRLPGVNEIYLHWLLTRLRKRYPGARVVTFDHTSTSLRRHFPGYVYFCNDDFIGNSKVKLPLADLYHRYTEPVVARHAAAIFATSPYLVEKLSRHNSRTYEIPLGSPTIDADLLASVRRDTAPEGLHLGLVGFMGKRTPAGLLNRLLDLEGARLTLIGPTEPGFLDKLSNRDRIVIKGAVTGDDLVREIAHFDVGLAPYDLAHINRGGTPNKLWQYLAVGRPVVVTELPNMAHWSFPDGCVYIARNEDEFVELVARARAEDSPELVERRIRVARENTWDRRVERMLELLG